jgi:hypothetical protein
MSLAADMLPYALDALDEELAEHESEKRGEWRRKDELYLLSHGQRHNTAARLMIAYRLPREVPFHGHTFAEHVRHSFVRAAMAVQRNEERRRNP